MAEGSFALAVQRMPTQDAVLVLGQVAGWRGDSKWFRSSDVRDLYLALRVPEPANLSRSLGRLRDGPKYVVDRRQASSLEWAITPEGEHRAQELIAGFDYSSIAVELAEQPGAVFAAMEHPTLPPSLAPPAWAPGIRSFLDHFPFERNVFLMTRFPAPEQGDVVAPIIGALRSVMGDFGLALHVASDQQIVDDLWGNVGAHMWASRFGIGLLETQKPQADSADADSSSAGLPVLTLNDNVLIELGSMLTIGRRCMILKDAQAPMPPTDLTSQIFKSVDFHDLDAITAEAKGWVQKDLRL